MLKKLFFTGFELETIGVDAADFDAEDDDLFLLVLFRLDVFDACFLVFFEVCFFDAIYYIYYAEIILLASASASASHPDRHQIIFCIVIDKVLLKTIIKGRGRRGLIYELDKKIYVTKEHIFF